MAYVTKAEYDGAYPSNTLDDEEFLILSEVASAVIDRLTITRIPTFGGLDQFSAFTQDKVKKATNAQIHTLEMQGGVDAITGGSEALTGAITLGRYSENQFGRASRGKGIQMIDGLPISPLVSTFLITTGLLKKTLNTCERLSDFR